MALASPDGFVPEAVESFGPVCVPDWDSDELLEPVLVGCGCCEPLAPVCVPDVCCSGESLGPVCVPVGCGSGESLGPVSKLALACDPDGSLGGGALLPCWLLLLCSFR